MTGLIGHGEVFAAIRRAIAAGRGSHAYLVTGPIGVGRRTFAMELAKLWNCERPTAERPCESCRACRWIDRGVHPDVRVVKRAPERRGILLRPPSGPTPTRDYSDNVEFIQSDAQLRPAVGSKKIYLVLNVEELQQDAANRLLKTLEEPSAYVRFVLTATDRGAVIPTILSRCQEIRLRPVARVELARELSARNLAEEERAMELAALAGGRPGVALAATGDAAWYELYQADIRDLRLLTGTSRLERLTLARAASERWSSDAPGVRAMLRAWSAWWRDVTLVQVGLPDRVVHSREEEMAGLRRAARVVGAAEARAAIALLQQTLQDLEANVNRRLALDLLFLRLPLVRAISEDEPVGTARATLTD